MLVRGTCAGWAVDNHHTVVVLHAKAAGQAHLPAVVKFGDSTKVSALNQGSSTNEPKEIQLGNMDSKSTIG